MTLVIGFFNEKLAQDQLLTLNIFNPSSNISILDFNIWVFTRRDFTDSNNYGTKFSLPISRRKRKNTSEIPKLLT